VLYVDTVNSRVGVGTTTPARAFHALGSDFQLGAVYFSHNMGPTSTVARVQINWSESSKSLTINSYGNDVMTWDIFGTSNCLRNMNVASGYKYQLGGVDVLSATTLGSGVVNSSLTSVGTLTSLTVSGNTNASNVICSSGVILPTSGGTASTLAYYEAYTHSAQWTWMGTTNSTLVTGYAHKIVRVGNQVTLCIAQLNFTTPPSFGTGYLQMALAIPTRFCPTQTYVWPIVVYYGGSQTQTLGLSIDSSGNVKIGLLGGNPLSNMAVSTTFNYYGSTFNWSV